MKELHYVITLCMVCLFGFGIVLYVLELQKQVVIEQQKCNRIIEQNIILMEAEYDK